MAFTGNFVCTTFKTDLLGGKHNFTTTTGNAFKMALYTNTATLTAATTAYTASGEHGATGTYSTTGKALVIATGMPSVPSAATAVADFDDLTWGTSTISAYGALIYNDTQAGKNAVVVLDFGGVKSSSSGDFTVQFPPPDISQAIIRIA